MQPLLVSEDFSFSSKESSSAIKSSIPLELMVVVRAEEGISCGVRALSFKGSLLITVARFDIESGYMLFDGYCFA